jgi:hypothetical protein
MDEFDLITFGADIDAPIMVNDQPGDTDDEKSQHALEEMQLRSIVNDPPPLLVIDQSISVESSIVVPSGGMRIMGSQAVSGTWPMSLGYANVDMVIRPRFIRWWQQQRWQLFRIRMSFVRWWQLRRRQRIMHRLYDD